LTGFPDGAFDTDFIQQVYEFPARHPVKKPDRQGASIFTTESIRYKWTIDRFRRFISIVPAENSDDSTFRTNMSDITIPNADAIAAMRDGVVGQMRFAREYTLNLLSSVPDPLWNVIPNGGTSHIAWQVGHLAVSQYGLMLFRQRGRAEGDLELMPGWLRKKFGRGTKPPTDPADIPSKDELLATLERIHHASMSVVPTLSPELLAEATEMPFAVYPMKLGALLFCPLHESIHSGQIGLLRRLHGLEPVR
jgi:hypothetical protein